MARFRGATGAGIRATSTSGALVVNSFADMVMLSDAQNGILVNSGGGAITIGNAGQIGGVDDGVNSIAISAVNSNAGSTNTVSVTNNARLFVDNNAGAKGINATTLGTGAVTVVNAADIDPPVIAINAVGGGVVTVNNNAAIFSDTLVEAAGNPAGRAGASTPIDRGGGAVLNNLNADVRPTTFYQANISVTSGTGILAQSAGGDVLSAASAKI
jgi:hypothetical protein